MVKCGTIRVRCFHENDGVPFKKLIAFMTWEEKGERVSVNSDR